MKNLLSLLEKFSKTLDKDTHTKSYISTVIKEKTGASIPQENISVKNGVLELVTSPAVKNEISLKERAIKEELNRSQIFFSRILYK